MDEEIRDSDTLLDPFMASSLESRFEEYSKDFEVSKNTEKGLPTKVAVEEVTTDTGDKKENDVNNTEPQELVVLPDLKNVHEEGKRRENEAEMDRRKPSNGSLHSQLNSEVEIHNPIDHSIGDFIENREDAANGTSKNLLPLETKLIYGVQHDSSIILEDIKEKRSPAQSPTEEKQNHILTSAVKWLSKPSTNNGEKKFYLLTNSGEVVDPIASEKRNRDFHELFPQINPSEKLIEDYSCAWFNDVMLHGRMYISENHIAFYTKVIWTYTVLLPISNVGSIEKKIFGGFFDNAMEIQSKDGKKYYFTSFIYRNLAYDVLIKVVNGYPSNIIQPVLEFERRPSSAAMNQERRTRSDGSLNDVRIQPRTSSASYRQSEETRIAKGLADIVDIPRPPSATGSEADLNAKKHVIHQKIQVTPPTKAELRTSPRLVPLPSLPDKPFECECLNIHKTQRPALDEKILLDLEKVFESLVYSNSEFLRKFWSGLNYTGKGYIILDLKVTDWLPATADLNSPDIFKPVAQYLTNIDDIHVGFKRQTQYVRPINNPLGPKTSICIITETIKQISKSQICIESVTKTPGVPSGNAFQVITRTCILYNTGTTTRVLATCKVDYIASTWLKIALDKAVPDGVREYFQLLIKELRSFGSDTSGPSSKNDTAKAKSLEKLEPVNGEPALKRTTSMEKLNELVEFFQTNNIGLSVITAMIILAISNIVAIWLIFKLNSRVDFVMSQLEASAGQKLN